jgi:hypothetical protein
VSSFSSSFRHLLNLLAAFAGLAGLAGTFAVVGLHMDGLLASLVAEPFDFHCALLIYLCYT